MQIQFDKSFNYRKGRSGGSKITHIVVHTMSGSFVGTLAWFKNLKSQVSAHYCVSKAGEVVQMVQDEDTAWHVCRANPFTIGIELEDMTVSKDPRTGKTVQKTALSDPNWYTASELDALVELVASLMKKHEVPLARVVGHNDPFLKGYGNNHQDPGPYFPWARFRQLVTDKMGKPTEVNGEVHGVLTVGATAV